MMTSTLMPASPLVSCLTPTYNRRDFWPKCIQCFLSQDYTNLEWVIVDNSETPIKDLLPADPRIRYVRHPGERLSHGNLMNLCMGCSTGALACVLDDDDWYAPDRVRKQVQPLIDNPAKDIVGTSRLFYYVLGTQKAFRYVNQTHQKWLAAPAWRRSAWENNKFDNLTRGADTNFMNRIPKNRWVDLEDERLIASTIHPGNASPKRLLPPSFVGVPWASVEEITKGTL